MITRVLAAFLALAVATGVARAQVNESETKYREFALPKPTQERLKVGNVPAKLRRTMDELKAQRLIPKIKQVAAQYGIDPVHIVGAIVGEHVFNYDIRDDLQAVALQYGRKLRSVEFSCGPVKLETVLAQPQFGKCTGGSNQYWSCVEQTWQDEMRGKVVDGKRLPRRNLGESCFNPFGAGQTYGLGQLSPVTALKMMDTTKLPKISYKDADALYERIMDPSESLHVIAAVVVDSIKAYRAQGVDISNRPEITATLYNVGQPWSRAKASGGNPKTNYFGAFVQDNLPTLRELVR
jgi:hypothetical protein